MEQLDYQSGASVVSPKQWRKVARVCAEIGLGAIPGFLILEGQIQDAIVGFVPNSHRTATIRAGAIAAVIVCASLALAVIVLVYSTAARRWAIAAIVLNSLRWGSSRGP